MVIDGRQITRHAKIARRPFYVVTTFLVAFAFACPLFLLMRELRLRYD